MSNGWERFKAEQERRGTAGNPAGASRSGDNGFAEYQRRSAQRQSGQSGSSRSWQRYLWETQGIRPTASNEEVYRKSGMDALRKDAHTLTGGLTHYFKNKHTANAIDPQYRQKTRAMLDAIANERKYFDYYKDSFTAEDLQKYTAELDEYEAQLKAYDGYFGNGYGRATDKNSAIWGSGYSALSSGLTSFDKDVRGLMQGGRVVTDEAKTSLQRKQQALSSRLSATKRYMEQNAALFTPQERKQWQDEFSRYESYLNGVGAYLKSGQLGTTNPFTGKTVAVPNGGLTLEQDRQQREAVQQKITDVIDSFSNADRLGITAKNAQQEAQTAQGVVQRATRKRERLTAQRAEMEQQLKAIPDSEWQARNALVQQMQDVDTQIEAQRHTIETYTERGKVAQDVANAGEKYDEYRIGSMVQEALNAPDFSEKSKPQEGVYSYTVDDNVNVRLALSDDYDLSDATHIQNPEYGWINGTDDDRVIIGQQYAVHNGELDSFSSYSYLTNEEKGVFNYLWATKGKETAMEYLAALKPTLDYRNGAAMAQNSPGTLWGNVLSPMWRGLQGAMRNTEALLLGGEELPISPGEYETAIRRENAGEWGRHIIDASTSFGQMLPAMTISLATGNPTAGAAVTFVTSGAGAYQEGLRSGMTEGQALGYGALVGGAEGFLQAVAGGIPGLKGVLPEAVGGQIAGKINNAFGRWAVKFGANIASEVLEENVQNYLEPLFVTMLTGRDYEAPGWEEFVDTTLSTLLLTGATNLANAPSELSAEFADPRAIENAQRRFAEAALTFDADSAVHAAGEIVKARLDSGRLVSGEEFRSLLTELGADKAEVKKIYSGRFTQSDVDALRNTTERRATAAREQVYFENYQNLGWAKERASAAAAVLDKVVRGENVRNADIQKLRLNTEKGAAVLQDALGVPVKKAGNNNVAANQTFREAEMSYRMARSTAKYGEAEINWKTLPPTQESADAIMVHPEAKTALEEIRNKPFTGTYAEQTRQIMQQLSIWWAANASRFTPEAASIQVERWRAEHPQENAQFNIDNAEDSGYTESNGGVSNESDRMAGGMAEGVPGGQFPGRRDAGGRQNGRTNQVFSGRGLSQNLQRAFEQRGVVAAELYNFDADSAAFSAALEAARTADADHGWAVTPQSVEDLQGKTLLMDEGGTIGFAVTADGDIEAVFKNKQLNHTPHAMDGVMPQAIAAGGVKLDCYGKDLVRIYERYGFTPVARVEFNEQYANSGWDASKGTPYIYFMVHNGDSAETVAANIGKYPHMERSQLESLPTYGKEGYDQAAAQRDSLLSWRQQSETSVGAARSRFDQYSHAAIEYGTIEPGENPARVVDVPKSMDGQTMVSKLVRTAEEAGATAETAIPLIEEATTDGLFSYDRVTNEERRAKAAAWFENYNNTEAAYDAWREAAAGRKLRGMSLDAYGNGIYLYTELMANAKGAESTAMQQRYQRQAINVLSILQKSATEAGQLVQMNRMFKQLTPEGRVVSLQQSIENLNASLGKYAKQKVKLNEELVQQWVTALNNGQEQAATLAEKNIYHDIAAQVPSTFMEKWGAWRYLCMLGNPKTIIRNFGGNVAMMPAKALKDKVGALLELTLDKSERTKYLGILSASEEGRALKTYALREFENTDLKNVITGAGKYDDSNVGGKISEAIRDAHSELPGVFGKAQDAVDFLMNNEYFGDLGFLKHHYTVSFAEAMMARGYTVADIEQGNIPAAQLDSIRAYAINQAQKATYRDINAFSKLVRNIRFRGESTSAAFGNLVIEGVLPFKATPANVLVRAAEYGPLGIVKAIGEWAQNRAIQIAQSGIESGKLNGTIARSLASKEMTSGVQIIEDLSSGLSGMALFGLGVLLKNLGVVSGDADDDDDRTGIQARSLNIGGVSISLDWLSPAAVPFFTGVSVADAWNDPHKSAIDAVADSVGAMFQPLLELSMLSSVQELLDTMTYGDGASAENIIYGVFVQPFFSYLAQGIPTLSAQLARTLEPNSQYTYTGDLGGSMAKRLVKSLAGIAKKIPFVNWRQYDYVDAWGRTESNGRWDERIFNNFFNPAYVSDIEITDADEEIARLEAVTGEEVSPSRRQYSIKMNGERRALTGEEYERYSKEYGEKALEMMTVLMASADYAQMNDEEKVAALKSVLSLADEYGKHAAIDNYTPKSEDKLYQLTQTGLSVTDAYAAKTVSKQLAENPAINATTAASRFKNWVSQQNWTEAQEKAVMEAYGKFMTHIPAGTEKYDALAEAIGEDTALSVVDRLATLEPEDGADTVSAAQKIGAIAGMSISDKDKWAAFQEYKDDWRIAFFRKAEINPSVYAAYLEAAPEYRLTADGKKSSAWNKTTIWNWLRTTEYSYAVRQKVAQIALMDKPKEDGKK